MKLKVSFIFGTSGVYYEHVRFFGRIKIQMRRYIWGILLAVVVTGVIGSIFFFEYRMEKGTQTVESYEEIYMVLPTYGYVPEDMEAVLDAMNQISIKRCGVKVNYIFSNVSDMAVTMNLRLEAGEQIDLMPVMEGRSLASYIASGKLAPLNDLLDGYGAGIRKMYPSKLWEALGKDGTIYAIAPLNSMMKAEGLLIRADILDALDVDPAKLTQAYDAKEKHTVADVDRLLSPLFQQIAVSDKLLADGSAVADKKLVPGSNNYGGIFSQCRIIPYEGFGNSLGCAVNDSAVLVNLYETEEYREMLKLIRKWQKAGYIYNVNSSMAENPAMIYSSGMSSGLFSNTTKGQAESMTHLSGYATECISLVEKTLTSEIIQLGSWVIPTASEHRAAAMKILDLMYTDKEYVTLYTYGIEGVHYRENTEGVIEILSDGYTQNLTWMFGNCLLASPDAAASEQNLESFRNASYSPYFGFIYNDERYADEIEDMQQILDNWLPDLENGRNPDIDGALAQMNAELHAAGLDAVIRDKQEQLDRWLKTK